MTRIQRSALLPYPADKLFALVSDIESYPRFMDGCVAAEVLARDANVTEARLDLSRGGISQSFSTRNRAHGDSAIDLSLLEGPFDHFNGRWEFRSLGDGACKVSLDLEFHIRNGVLSVAAGKLFDSVTGSLVDAVTRRAQELYG